jgi:hypothetical protein
VAQRHLQVQRPLGLAGPERRLRLDGSDGVAASVRRIQNAFMRSPGHRRNILYRKANLFGVGTFIKDDIIWVTVNFEQTTPGWG